MTNTDIKDTDRVFEHLKRGLGLVHEVKTLGHDLPLYGRLIAVNDSYISIEKRDGRVITLKHTEILSIGETYNQPPRSEVV